jgi:hypothetical protein
MKALISIFGILAFSFCVLVIMCGTISPINYQEEKKIHKAEYVGWWIERDYNNWKTEQEWTR